jgi:ParB/RepB/Spo0J family partition protein
MQATLFDAEPTSEFNENYPITDLGEIVSAVRPTSKMVASVKAHGVLQPIILRGKELVAGRRRVLASIAAGRTTIPVRIFPAEFSNRHILSLVENEQRRNNPVSDLRSVEALIDSGMTDEEICTEVGCTKPRLRKILALRNLEPLLRKLFEDGIIKFSVAELIAKKPKYIQALLLEHLEIHGDLRLKDVQGVLKVQRKAALAALPDSLFGNTVPIWRTQVEQKLEEIRTLAEKDADAEWLEKLDDLMEGL